MKINGKNFNVKNYRELSLQEYKDIINLMKDNTKFSLFDYVAYLSGMNFDVFKLQKVKGIEQLHNQLGQLKIICADGEMIPDAIEKLPLKRFFAYEAKLFDFSNVDMKSKVGYRIVIEQYLQDNPNYLDLYTFTFATVLNEKLTKSFDYESILQVKENLKNYNAYDILGNGAFFFSNLINGERSVRTYLKTLKSILIKTIRQVFKRE